MANDKKIYFCFLCCILSFVISLVIGMANNFEITDLKETNRAICETSDFQNNRLKIEVAEQKKLIEKQNESIEKQNRTIELYKGFVDDTVHCIINGIW